MKITIFLLFAFMLNVTATVYSQVGKVSLQSEDQEIADVLREIEEKTEYSFFYQREQIDVTRKVSVQVEEQSVKSVLDQIFEGKSIQYHISKNNTVILLPKLEQDFKALQGVKVTGQVTDKNGVTLPGVNVVIKGKDIGTITDINGNFSISVEEGELLVFSFVGFSPQEVKVNAEVAINIILEEETIGLNEVVAIGYGSQRKRDLTGSVVSVNSEQLQSIPVASVGDALQGKAAGVQVISSGVPGNDVVFRIRGIGTINDNNPLLVIDDVPTSSGLNQLNMNDIESVQILKDASATAIYGSRGANGVIIITTKKGRLGKSSIDINYNYGIQEATKMVNVLNASQFASLHNEMMENAGLAKNPANASPESLGKGTDWLDKLFSPESMHNLSLSFSGGNDKTKYYVSGSILDQKGIVAETGFKRYTVKFNLESKVLKNIRIGNNITLNHDKKYNGDYSVKNTMLALPTQAIFNEDGTYAGPKERPSWDGDITNPIGKAKLVETTTKGYNLLGSVFAEVDIIKGLKFKTNLGLQANFWDDRTWSPQYNWLPSPQEQSYLFQQSNKSITWNWDNTLTYNKIINGNHRITLMAGTSAQENRFDFHNGSIQNFASDQTQQLANGISQPTVNGNASEWSLMSYIGRFNYVYSDKYMLTATVRRDGSSRFGSDNKWGTFPSASVAWRLSEENFLKNVKLIDDLKLRAGYGITGNQSIGNYSFASVFQTNKYNFNNNVVSAVVPDMMPNPNVQWESQKQTNIGLDATLFNQRVNLTIDGYIKNTEDMLVPMSVPISTGYSDINVPYINAGKIQNKGIEINISTRNMKGEFAWNTDLNLSYNKNEVKNLNDTIPMVTGNGFDFNFAVSRIAHGHPVNAFYGFITDGIFQTQAEVDAHAQQVPGLDPYNRTSAGDIRFKDLNSDGIIDDSDRTYMGNPTPELIFSMNNYFSYKGFDLNIFLQGVYGNEIFNANRIWNEGMAVAVNQSAETLNRWTGPNTSNSMPRAVFNDPNKNTRASDRWIEDGSYLRIKNISLGYTLPKTLISQIGLESLRLYVSGTNLYTFTKYKGFDPEVSSGGNNAVGSVQGIDHNIYPVTRTISMGVNVRF